MTRLEIHKKQLAVNLAFPEDWVVMKKGLQASEYKPFDQAAVVSMFTTFLNETCNTVERKTISLPLTWWDMFKVAVYPSRLLKYFPAKYKDEVLTTNHYFLCPHVYFDGKPVSHVEFLSQGKNDLKGD